MCYNWSKNLPSTGAGESKKGLLLRVYLDTSVYNRLFDDQTQPRIWLETMALALILQMIEMSRIQLVGSTVVKYENSRNPYPLRRQWVARCLLLASDNQRVDEAIRERSDVLVADGLKAIDALHVACAEAARCDYFLTCDDQIVRRYTGERVEVFNPVSYLLMVTGEQG